MAAGRGGLGMPCILVIVIAGMERFAFKGILSNLVTYLTDVGKMSNSAAAKVVNTWCGFSFIMPLFVSPFTASFWDHYFTILTFSVLYVAGLVTLTSTALDWPWLPKVKKTSTAVISFPILLSSLFIIAFAQGGYNPSLQAFGVNQLGHDDDDDDEDQLSSSSSSCNNIEDQTKKCTDKKSLFFTWWYFGVVFGGLLGLSIMSYIQDTISWGLGFGIPTVVMVFSIVFFASGSRFYIHHNQGKVIVDDDHRPSIQRYVSHCIKALVRKIFRSGWNRGGYEDSTSAKPQDIELELQGRPLCGLKSMIPKQADQSSRDMSRSSSFTIPRENIKVVLRLLPIWAMLLVFAAIFQQPSTFFTKQGMTMKRNIGSKFMIPPATLQGAINVSVFLMIPFYDKVIVPLTRMITKNEKGLTVMRRMGIGMFLSTIAMIIAALVEERRLMYSRQMDQYSFSAADHNMNDHHGKNKIIPFSIFWLLPQYILLGISDVFTVVGMQEFFYREVPLKMKTVGIALCTSVFGFGSFLSAVMVSVIDDVTSCGGKKPSWFSDDMAQASLDKFYWLLAFGCGLSLLIYLIICKFYKSINDLPNEQ